MKAKISEPRQGRTSLDYALVCVAPIIWGVSGVLVRWTHLAGHEQVLIFYRSCFAVAFYSIVMLATRRRIEFKSKGEAPLLITSGLLAAAFALCVFKAYSLLPIGVATFILYLFPVLVAVTVYETALAPTGMALGVVTAPVLTLIASFTLIVRGAPWTSRLLNRESKTRTGVMGTNESVGRVYWT